VRGDIVATHRDYPDEVLVSLNLRDRTLFDVYRLHLRTGALTLDTENPGDVVGWQADAQFKVRGATVSTPDGGTEIRVRAGVSAPWKTLLKVGPEENVGLLEFTADGKSVYLESSLGRDTAAVVERAIEGANERLVAASEEVDVGNVMIHPVRHVVEAVSFEPGRSTWKVLDPGVQADFDGSAPCMTAIFMWRAAATRTTAGWWRSHRSGFHPVLLVDRKAKKGELMFVAQPKLDAHTLAPMKPVVITARDGLKLNAYLTLPVGIPSKNLPMVLNVHGGPWARDNWGFAARSQLYANRGYAVLQVNYRGSTGYGKRFLNAANRQWGLKMHDDLIDAVNWAVAEGIADPKKVAIAGGSYGGYATLAGLAFTPEGLCLRRGHCRAVEHQDALELDSSLLEADAERVSGADRRHQRSGRRGVDPQTRHHCFAPTRFVVRC
jgi:acetyl esterase/lipase